MYKTYQPTIQQFLDKNCQHVYIGGNLLAILYGGTQKHIHSYLLNKNRLKAVQPTTKELTTTDIAANNHRVT